VLIFHFFALGLYLGLYFNNIYLKQLKSKQQALASTLAGPSWQMVPPYWSICHRLPILTVFFDFNQTVPSPYRLDGQNS